MRRAWTGLDRSRQRTWHHLDRWVGNVLWSPFKRYALDTYAIWKTVGHCQSDSVKRDNNLIYWRTAARRRQPSLGYRLPGPTRRFIGPVGRRMHTKYSTRTAARGHKLLHDVRTRLYTVVERRSHSAEAPSPSTEEGYLPPFKNSCAARYYLHRKWHQM